MSNLPGRPLLLLPYVLPTLACKYTFLLLAFYILRYLFSIQLEAWGWNRSIEQHILEGDAVSAWFCKLWLRLMFAKCEGCSGTAPPPPLPTIFFKGANIEDVENKTVAATFSLNLVPCKKKSATSFMKHNSLLTLYWQHNWKTDMNTLLQYKIWFSKEECIIGLTWMQMVLLDCKRRNEFLG